MSTTLAAADVMASTNIAKRVRRSSMRVVLLRSSWTWTLWRPDGAAVPESDGDEPTIEAVAGQRCRRRSEGSGGGIDWGPLTRRNKFVYG